MAHVHHYFGQTTPEIEMDIWTERSHTITSLMDEEEQKRHSKYRLEIAREGRERKQAERT
jgi:ribosome maturation factor RimP